MEIAALVLLLAGGFVAGAVTAVAGGGSFLTFPMLLAAGLPPMSASITNWVALIPGNLMALAGYRKELTEMRHQVRANLWVAAIGGFTGSVLLLWTGEARFAKAVPWLMLTATLFFAFGEWIKRRLHAWRRPVRPASRRGVLLFEFVLMVYGGYFGAGLGIILLAALAMGGESSIHKAKPANGQNLPGPAMTDRMDSGNRQTCAVNRTACAVTSCAQPSHATMGCNGAPHGMCVSVSGGPCRPDNQRSPHAFRASTIG